ncbi:MAG: hypothetical protein R3C28_29175 [Pirellulaceae bacterium]
MSQDAEVHQQGVRASDKGFLNVDLETYLELLKWTAKQRVSESVKSVPQRLQALLSSLGIEANMWRDLVWNFKRYFGNSSCAGSPNSMAEHAESTGKRFHRGQRRAEPCFAS